MRKRPRVPGFTLVEVLIVVVVLGILAAIVVPSFADASDNAQAARITQDLRMVQQGLEMYALRWNALPPSSAGPGQPPAGVPLDRFVRPEFWRSSPLEGVWTWNNDPGNRNVCLGNVANNPSPITNPVLLDVDRVIDDRNLASGRLRWAGSCYEYRIR